MARGIYVYRAGRGVIPIEEATPTDNWQPNLGVITDTLDKPLEHPCDGKMYDSKSAFRATTRAHGDYELGNDMVGKMKPAINKDIEVFPKEKIYKELWDKL